MYLLCPHQHGFRKNRSCETQVIGLIIDDLSKGLDGDIQIDVILLDFSKAFDKAHHTSLLKKLISDKYRDKNTFFIPYARTNAYKYSFFPSGIRA